MPKWKELIQIIGAGETAGVKQDFGNHPAFGRIFRVVWICTPPQAESELQRATMDATRTTRQLEETIDEFERHKIRDIKVWSSRFFHLCKKCNFTCVQCFCKSSSWNQTVVISTVCFGACPPHLILPQFGWNWTCFVVSELFSCLEAKKAVVIHLEMTQKVYCLLKYHLGLSPFRKSLETLWRWRCCSTLRPWRCSPWPTRAFKT